MIIDFFLHFLVAMPGVEGNPLSTPEVLILYFMTIVKPFYHKRSM